MGLFALVLLATGPWQAPLPARAPAAPIVPTDGAVYPHNLPLTTLDGKPVNLSDLKGKVVFVNLWASWCPPCRTEMPGIHALYKKMDPQKVAFVMISLDEKPAKAQALLQRRGYTFPVYFSIGPLPAPFDSNSISSTVILCPRAVSGSVYIDCGAGPCPLFAPAHWFRVLEGGGKPRTLHSGCTRTPKPL